MGSRERSREKRRSEPPKRSRPAPVRPEQTPNEGLAWLLRQIAWDRRLGDAARGPSRRSRRG